MGNDFRRGILYAFLVILAVLFPIHAFETSSFSDQNNLITLFNGTINKDCILDVNGGNHLPKRLLQGQSALDRYISYGAIQKPRICNGNIYGNCIVPIGPSYRPCTVYTRCKRGLRTSLSKAALPESKTNTTTYDETIAEYIEGEVEVFFGEFGIRQRVLAGYPAKSISYRSLEKPPICNANIYGNCIKPIGKGYRPCTVYTRCKRGL
ncbi:hypothetical protein CRYUN_Cryun20dG0120000 [Craigia yunnanensis]